MLDYAASILDLPATTPAARLSRSDLQAMAEQLANGRRIEAGCVTVIALDAIRDRLGERWPRKREQVWEAFERMLERRLPPSALYARMNETDYLVEAGADAVQAQFASFRLLKEAHQFFLGEHHPNAMRVEAVTAYADGVLTRRPLAPPAQVEAPTEPKTFAAAPLAPRDRWSALSFVAAGHRVQVAFEHQGVIQLASNRPSATRLRRVVMVDGQVRPVGAGADGLSPGELAAIDRATLAEVVTLGDTPVVAPFFFETASSARGRAAMLSAMGGAPAKNLLVELIGVDAGTPQSRLLETVSLLSPYCAGVIARAPAGRPCAPTVSGARLSGLSVECEDGARAKLGAAAMLADCRAQMDVGRMLFAFGLPSAAALPLARAAGATHASLLAAPVV